MTQTFYIPALCTITPYRSEWSEWIKLLKTDIPAFNTAKRKWQEENPNVRLDLVGANLTNTNLSGADLSNTDTRYANFFGVYMDDADLSNAIVTRRGYTATGTYSLTRTSDMPGGHR